MLKRAAVAVLLPLLYLCLPGPASAQWATSGNNINNTNPGNVGIGTAAPTSKLEVVDSSYNGVAARFVQTEASASNGVFIKTQTASASDASLYVASNAGATVSLVVRNNGNVGIGAINPTDLLEVKKDQNGPTRVFATNEAAGTLALTRILLGAHAADTDVLFTSYNTGFSGNGLLGLPAAGSAELAANTSATGMVVGTRGAAPFIISTGAAERLRVLPDGNVGIGTTSPTAKLHVGGDGRITGNLTVDGNITAKYQDVAEWVPSTQQLAAGTVVALDTARANHVVASAAAYDTRVAGVVSAQPGLALGERGEGKVLVATTGRVKVKVDATRGPIQIGDLIVTSDVAGVAMKSEPISVGGRQLHAPGTIIGKALEPLSKGTGEILVLLSLQ
jgi:hypothetical protein